MKKLIFAGICLIFISFFLIDPSAATEASARGLMLWFTKLLPTLLPFCVISYTVLASGLLTSGKNGINREAYVLLCGFIFGFPIGAKLSCDLYKKGELSKENAHLLCSFANNLSPVYVLSALNETLGFTGCAGFFVLLYGVPLILCLFGLKLFDEPLKKREKPASGFHLNMQIVDAGIINGFETLIKICGYIMLFSMLSEILKAVTPNRTGLILTGLTEVTNGIASLGSAGLGNEKTCMLALLFLSLNGLSGFFQTASLMGEAGLSPLRYGLSKLMTTGLIMMIGFILLSFGLLC